MQWSWHIEVTNHCLARNRRIIIVSPHSDDAAFSLGCTLSHDLRSHDVSILCVFSQSTFARNDYGYLPTKVSRIRRNEDRSFCKAIGVNVENLGFWDAPDRLGIDAAHVFNLPLTEWQNDLGSLRNAISKFVCDKKTVLILPAGIGGHVDHVAASTAGSQVADEIGLERMYYADQPYLFEDRRNLLNVSKALVVHSKDITADQDLLRQKLEHIAYYPSQPASLRLRKSLQASRKPFEELLLSSCPKRN